MFASATVTEERLAKGFAAIEELCKVKKMSFAAARAGEFMTWLWKDIFSEEANEMKERGVETEKAKKEIAVLGKKWFREQMKVEQIKQQQIKDEQMQEQLLQAQQLKEQPLMEDRILRERLMELAARKLALGKDKNAEFWGNVQW
jgi:HrpA-like RNA helicase